MKKDARGRLTINDRDGALLAEVHRTEGRLYLLKLKVEDNCLLTKQMIIQVGYGTSDMAT